MFSSSVKKKSTIKVLIADDHSLFRQGLKKLLQNSEGVEVVAEASSGDECFSLARKVKPDVILMDLSMPSMEEFEPIRKLKKIDLNLKILALSMHSERYYVIEAVRSGCDGYILKNASFDELLRAIKAVMKGGSFFSPQIARHLAESLVEREEGALTFKEREILKLVASGKKNKEIAERLFMSEKTVKNYLADIYSKLNANDRLEAVLNALKLGLIERKDFGADG